MTSTIQIEHQPTREHLDQLGIWDCPIWEKEELGNGGIGEWGNWGIGEWGEQFRTSIENQASSDFR